MLFGLELLIIAPIVGLLTAPVAVAVPVVLAPVAIIF